MATFTEVGVFFTAISHAPPKMVSITAHKEVPDGETEHIAMRPSRPPWGMKGIHSRLAGTHRSMDRS